MPGSPSHYDTKRLPIGLGDPCESKQVPFQRDPHCLGPEIEKGFKGRFEFI